MTYCTQIGSRTNSVTQMLKSLIHFNESKKSEYNSQSQLLPQINLKHYTFLIEVKHEILSKH